MDADLFLKLVSIAVSGLAMVLSGMFAFSSWREARRSESVLDHFEGSEGEGSQVRDTHTHLEPGTGVVGRGEE